MVTVRKFKLTILGDEETRKQQYNFIRNSQYAQYQGLNLAMGILTSAYISNNRDVKSEGFKEAQKSLCNSNPIFDGIEFGKGVDSKSAITQKVKKDFSISLKNGLAKGERNVTNYKRSFPLMTRGRDLKFRYEDKEVHIKWVNKIEFKIVLGSKGYNDTELMHTLHKIINKEYKVSQSSLTFDKNNNLILILTFDIPVKENKIFIEGRTLGVDLGIKYPAYVCLSDDIYKKQHVGCSEDFIRVREQIKSRRKRLQEQLNMVKGGKGRQHKLKALERIKDKERNFVKTYNHMISKNVVEFAKKHKCEFIKMEKLTKDGFPDMILSNWSYYELQHMIGYKAEREGIKVLFVNPSYTSQQCSRCGNIDKENRKTQEQFICTKCGFKLNADHNAAINIARSNDTIK